MDPSWSPSQVAYIKGVIDCGSLRQHLKAPDSTVAEVVAAGTAMHKLVPIRGLAHECRITQVAGTPAYIDSSSTVFVAKDQAAAKRSVWINRRVAVLLEAKEEGEVDPIKIDAKYNVSDGMTKPLSHAAYMLHLGYTHNII